MTSGTTQKRNAIDWEFHINNYIHSGHTKAAYCESQGLRVKQFEYYYRRWKENIREDERFAAVRATKSEFSPVVVTSSAMVEGSDKLQVPLATHSGVELEFANGVRCNLAADFCQATLKRLMELL